MSQRAQNEETPVLHEVEGFEHASAGAERVLLRIDGRYGDRPGKRVLDATLFVDDGLVVHRHDPLPDAAGDGDAWLWRAAFDVPAHFLTDERTRFALEAQPGRVLDLGHPSEILRPAPALPISARAAHSVRRYAAAIAVLVTVAVTPGGLPASARTEVLRVHNPDGSVTYLTRDGQPLGQLPPDAVVIDQPAPAAPAPAPEPAPEPAPAPDPQPAPEPDPQPAPEQAAPDPSSVPEMADGVRVKPDAGADTPKQTDRNRDHGARYGVQHSTGSQGGSAGEAPVHAPEAAPQTSAPAAGDGDRGHATAPADPAPLPEPDQAADLQELPALMVAPGDGESELQPLSDVDPEPVPTEGLTSLDLLDAAADVNQQATTPEPPPMTSDAPPLIQLDPDKAVPRAEHGDEQPRSGSDHHGGAQRDTSDRGRHPGRHHPSHHGGGPDAGSAPVRQPDGTPTPANPGYFDALPGPPARGSADARHPRLLRRAPRPVAARRRPRLRDRQVPRPALPAADLPGRRDPVRHPLGGARGDQRDRDRLRPQPERLDGRRARLDAVHAGDLADVRRRRQQGRQEGPVQPRRRDLRLGPLPQGRRRRPGHPARDLRLQPRRLVRRLGDAPRQADRGLPGRPRRLADRPHRGPLPGRGPREVRERDPRPERRHLRRGGCARRRGQRRGGQEDRPRRAEGPLRRHPGRLRQPVHLLQPRIGLEALPGAEGGGEARREGARGVGRPHAEGRRQRRQPGAPRQPPSQASEAPPGRRGQAAPVRPPRSPA